jgi:serine/threonine protein kinase
LQSIGKYHVIASLARGGMGDVYLTVMSGPAGFNKLSVIKALRTSLAEDEQFLAMFLDEARLAARLHHRNIVQTNEVGTDDGQYFIAMEYLDGQTLHRLRNRVRKAAREGESGAVPLAVELYIMRNLLSALEYAHSLPDFDGSALGIVHRDVSPHNVFLTYDGEVKLVDFGIAKARDSTHETMAGVFKGKVVYMAPEQARGERADRRIDIFSAGVMLAEAICGQRLWPAQLTEQMLLHNLVNGELPNVRERAANAPEELLRICERALAANPEDRYATAAEFLSDLDRYVRTSMPDALEPKHLEQVMAKVFAADRIRVRAIVDSQLRTLKGKTPDASGAFPEGEPSGSSLPMLDAEGTVTGQKSDGARVMSRSVTGEGTTDKPSGAKKALMAVVALAAITVAARVGFPNAFGPPPPAPAPPPHVEIAAAPPPATTTALIAPVPTTEAPAPVAVAPAVSATAAVIPSASAAKPTPAKPAPTQRTTTPAAKPETTAAKDPEPKTTPQPTAVPTSNVPARPKRGIDKDDPYSQ